MGGFAFVIESQSVNGTKCLYKTLSFLLYNAWVLRFLEFNEVRTVRSVCTNKLILQIISDVLQHQYTSQVHPETFVIQLHMR